jgi:hypothetical protein|tara:strand:+ start:65 stop:214 length:150 start_codon:yes stop_codon:yes gene_type:complete
MLRSNVPKQRALHPEFELYNTGIAIRDFMAADVKIADVETMNQVQHIDF